MLHTTQDLDGCLIRATDGMIGHVEDLYFDDESWVVRYLVVDTGTWLYSRKVLISPIAIDRPDWPARLLPVSMNREQVRHSPGIDTDKPVSRQHERTYLSYFGYPAYWGGTGLWGAELHPNMTMLGPGGFVSNPYPLRPAGDGIHASPDAFDLKSDDHHLHDSNAVARYHVEGSDGDIGHVASLLIDEETWAIRYLVVNTGSWWLGHEVLVAPAWIREVSWGDSTVYVELNRRQIQDAPPYESPTRLTRESEASLHRHYGHPGYWTAEAKRGAGQSER